MRARALARARAVLPPGAVPSPAPPLPPEAPATTSVAPGYGQFRIALAVSVAVACAAVGAVAALHGRSAHAPRGISPEISPPVQDTPAARISTPSREPSSPDVKRAVAASPPGPAHAGSKQDPFAAELDLLQRAHAAYTRREFSVALTLVAEHARRFPRGQLAEQREALRVRSLVGSGRVDEAHRAAVAFALRFPRSVLLPQIEGSPESFEPWTSAASGPSRLHRRRRNLAPVAGVVRARSLRGTVDREPRVRGGARLSRRRRLESGCRRPVGS